MVQIAAYSARTFLTPRNRNWRKPRACLFCPNTGSTTDFAGDIAKLPLTEAVLNSTPAPFASACMAVKFAKLGTIRASASNRSVTVDSA